MPLPTLPASSICGALAMAPLPLGREPCPALCTERPGVANPDCFHSDHNRCDQEFEQSGPVAGLCWAVGHCLANKGSFFPPQAVTTFIPGPPFCCHSEK